MADHGAFADIARSRAVPWRRIAFLMCGDWARAEDIVQLALIRMYRHWHRIDVTGVDLYARKVIFRLAIDEARRPHRRAELLDTPPDRPAEAASPDDALVIRAALLRVPTRQRAVLVLRFYCDLSVAQTAAVLRVSEGTVKSQTARGLATLRSFLPESAYFGSPCP